MKSIVEPVLKSVVEPVIEPVIKPVIEPVVEPFVEPFVKPAVEPVVQPYVHSHMRIPYYPQTPIAYGNHYAPNHPKISKSNNFVETVLQTVVEPVVKKIGNAVVEKIKLLKSGIGKSGSHHRRPYFGRN